MSNDDFYTQLTVNRLFKDPEREHATFIAKKTIYLVDVISYEEGTFEFEDFPGPNIYIVTANECFYCQGKFEEFDKRMERFIKGLRESLKNDS